MNCFIAIVIPSQRIAIVTKRFVVMRKITEVPADLPVDWVLELKQTLLELTHKKPREISSFVPKDVVLELLKRTEEILEREPALLEACDF